jgi:hypothetical protein
MATIPNLAPQPQEQPEQSQQFQPSMRAQVQPEMRCTFFNLQNEPFTIKTTVVPDELMVQVVAMWLDKHPEEAFDIIHALKQKQKQNLDIIRTVQKSKV